VARYIEHKKKEAREQGYVTTLFGRRRYLAGIRSTLPYIRAEAERQAVNAPVQGTSADIIKIAMIDVQKQLLEMGLSEKARLVLQIHDELIYEVAEDSVDKIVFIIKKSMESALPDEMREGVPIVVGVQTGRRWSEMTEFSERKSQNSK
jgi:DNA polymerase-1